MKSIITLQWKIGKGLRFEFNNETEGGHVQLTAAPRYLDTVGDVKLPVCQVKSLIRCAIITPIIFRPRPAQPPPTLPRAPSLLPPETADLETQP